VIVSTTDQARFDERQQVFDVNAREVLQNVREADSTIDRLHVHLLTVYATNINTYSKIKQVK